MSLQLTDIKKHQRKTKKKASWLSKVMNYNINLSSKSFSNKKKETFFGELYILLSSGLDFRSALEIVVAEQNNEKDKAMYTDVYNKVVRGISLSDALEDTGKFNKNDYYSIKIGEETGRIAEVLEDLTSYYTRMIKQNRQLVSVFSYPILVLITAFVAVFFMLNVMVPKFQDIFNRSNAELPGLTKKIMQLSQFTSENFGIFFLFIVSIIVFIYSIRKKETYRRISSSIALKLPYFGNIIRMMVQQKLFQTLALLTASKITLSQALQLVRQMTTFYPMQKALEKMENDILHGKSLHESMEECSIFDQRANSLVKVGEEVNKLEDIFTTLNKQYAEQLEHSIGMLGDLLEPILIIFIGLLVGVILVAMYLPMFQMGSVIH
ncbi:MAG: type II secretion system F family protein [Paludibacteraceae bacterium]|nr:type II secretion system F family protein [Paludibacteraceae bacterium]